MQELKQIMKNYASRKWIVTIAIMVMAYQMPIAFKNAGISDAIILGGMALLAGVGVAYGIVNVKDSK